MKKILLVEDDPNLGLLLQDYLQLKGKFEVVLCTDGDEGLRAFTKQSYDLLILDVMMPKKDGFEVLKDLKASKLANIPVIVTSNLSQPEDKQKALSLGAKEYIVKSDTPIQAIVEKLQSYSKS